MVLLMFSFEVVMTCTLTCDTAESDTSHLTILAGGCLNLAVDETEGSDHAVHVL